MLSLLLLLLLLALWQQWSAHATVRKELGWQPHPATPPLPTRQAEMFKAASPDTFQKLLMLSLALYACGCVLYGPTVLCFDL